MTRVSRSDKYIAKLKDHKLTAILIVLSVLLGLLSPIFSTGKDIFAYFSDGDLFEVSFEANPFLSQSSDIPPYPKNQNIKTLMDLSDVVIDLKMVNNRNSTIFIDQIKINAELIERKQCINEGEQCSHAYSSGYYNVELNLYEANQTVTIPVSLYLKPQDVDRIWLAIGARDYGLATHKIEISLRSVGGNWRHLEPIQLPIAGSCGCGIKDHMPLSRTFKENNPITPSESTQPR